MELYRQLLNRTANQIEILRGVQELQQGKSKADVLKRVISSGESIMLYIQPTLILHNDPTICQVIRTFFRADPYTFIKKAYLEICGYNLEPITDQMMGLKGWEYECYSL
jgi:hypothetical protein